MKIIYVLSHKLSDAFVSLARHIALNPKRTIILSVFSSLLFGIGMIRIRLAANFIFVFSPLNSRSHKEVRIINQLFPMNKSYNYDLLRATERSTFSSVIITSKDDKTLLRKSVFEEVVALNEMVNALRVKWKDRTYTYTDICAKNDGKCHKNNVLSYFDRISQIEANEIEMKYPLEIDLNEMSINLTGFDFGGVKTDITKTIIEAKAIRLIYVLDDSDKEIYEIGLKWEEEFRKKLSKYESNIVTVNFFASSDFDDLSWEFIYRGLYYGSLSAAIINTFCVACLMTSDWVTSKPTLAIAGCVSAQLAMLSSTGILSAFGVPLTNTNSTLIFLVLGIAVDDMFVLVSAWRTTNPKDSVETRLSGTYSRAAMPIVMTSLTNCISFSVGATVSVPSVRIFCAHGALAMIFDLIYQLTFFGGCMALDGYREEKKLHPFTFQPVILTEEAGSRSRWYQILFTRKSENNETDPLQLMKWFSDKLGYWISKKKVGITILIAFMLYIAGASWGCISLESSLQFKDLFFYNSYQYSYIAYNSDYFTDYAYPMQVSLNATLDYSDRRIQKQILKSVNRFHQNKYIQKFELNWLKQYLLNSKLNKTYHTSYNLSDPIGFINCLRNEFFHHPFGRVFRDDVKFNEDGKHIVASRFILIDKAISNIKQEKEHISEMRSIADSFQLPVTVHSFWWVASEIGLAIEKLSIQSICITAAAVILVYISLSLHLQSVILTMFSILSIEFGIIGYMSLLGITINPISIAILIFSVGFAVDPCTHIHYAYKQSNGSYRERIQQTLFAAGVPVGQGCCSTVLGVLPTLLFRHYITTVFVVLVCLEIVISFLHAIFLLPILLGLWDSILGIFCKRNSGEIAGKDAPATPQLVYTISIINKSRF